MDEVKVKITGAGFFKLLLKDLVDGFFGFLRHKADGELGGEVVAFPRITGERLFDKALRLTAVVAVGGVKVIDPVLIGVID